MRRPIEKLARLRRNWVTDLEAGRFDRLLADPAECDAWGRFALRTANTPGRERVVLRLAFQDASLGRWYVWASYRFGRGDLEIDRAELFIESITVPDEAAAAVDTPEEFQTEAIFEAR